MRFTGGGLTAFREKHRPIVIGACIERERGTRVGERERERESVSGEEGIDFDGEGTEQGLMKDCCYHDFDTQTCFVY